MFQLSYTTRRVKASVASLWRTCTWTRKWSASPSECLMIKSSGKYLPMIRWVKGSGGTDKARLHIKLEDSAISYLVKKWNELEINVEGDAVTAELVGGEASDWGKFNNVVIQFNCRHSETSEDVR